MIKYKALAFSSKYKDFTKDELFTAFMNQNIFLMITPVLYNQKIFDILKPVVNKDDDNETTWWKFWLKTVSIIARNSDLNFLEDTTEKILENSKFYTNEELLHLIFDFNSILVNLKKIELFPSIEMNLDLFYSKNEIPESIAPFYKNKNLILKILNKYIPDEAINDKMVKIVFGEYIVNNISRIDSSAMIKEFIYREIFHFSELNEDCIKNVCSRFISPKYRKSHPTVIKDIWNEINKIYDKPEK